MGTTTRARGNTQHLNKAIDDALDGIHKQQAKKNWTRFYWLMLCFILFFAAGCFLFAALENWSIRTSIYFSMVTIMTVGYGKYTPTDQNGKLVAIFYILLGVGLAAVALEEMFNNFVEQRIRYQRKLREKVINTATDKLGLESKLESKIAKAAKNMDEGESQRFADEYVSSKKGCWAWFWDVVERWPASVAFLKIVVFSLLSGYIFLLVEGKHQEGTGSINSLVDALYFVVVTGRNLPAVGFPSA